jgi:hypothetical protein
MQLYAGVDKQMIRMIITLCTIPARLIESCLYLLGRFVHIAGSWWALLAIILYYGYLKNAGMCVDDETYGYSPICPWVETHAIWVIWYIIRVFRWQFPKVARPAWWGLPQPKPKAPKPAKEIVATIPVKSHAETKQTLILALIRKFIIHAIF